MTASIFGQNPADITGALFKAKNLADLPDKNAARTSLNVPSKDDVLYNSVPVGMILPYWGTTAPAGYLPCSGQTITSGSFPDLVQFLNPGQSSATVPDLRGEFIRGLDNGRGVDIGRTLGTSQSATIVTGQALNNAIAVSAANTSTEFGSLWGAEPVASVPVGMDIATGAVGGLVTPIASNLGYVRPRNVAVLYCIKAYTSVANYTSSVNIAGLVSDYSTLNAAAVKYADFIGANQNPSGSAGYQKLPGGLILQWGSNAASSSVGTPVTITFPITFPTAALSVVLTRTATVVATDINSFSIGVITTTGFPVRSQLASATFLWFAVGI